jgi:hypothetical protein
MNKYIVFNKSFFTANRDYVWIAGVKYGLAYEDNEHYYIKRVKDNIEIEPYPVSKEFEFSLYEIKEKKHE